MQKFMERALSRLNNNSSIIQRLKISFLILIGLLVIPALVSVSMMAVYSRSYHGVIQRVERVSALKPIVRQEIPREVWYIVAGHITFEEGSQYALMDSIQEEIDALARSAQQDSQKELLVARRSMHTLRQYVDSIGELMRTEQPVAKSEALWEEVRNVSALVGEMLEEYADAEISAAALTSRYLNHTLTAVVAALLLLLGLTLLFAVQAQRSLAHAIHKPIAQLETFAGALAGGDLDARAPETQVKELHDLTESLNTMAGRFQELIDENRREQENLKKSELRTLQSQINPHFLYNTLDAIIWLAESDESDEVIAITRALSDFFRISLSQGKDWITLADEVRHLTGYLTILKVRYRDILNYVIDIPEKLYPQEVLKLLLQPLVENALYHGIKNRRGKGTVRISVWEENEWLHFSVKDDGAGMTPEHLEQVRRGLEGDGQDSAGYGLFNVNKRIKLYYNQPDGLHIESDPAGGTVVSFRVPVRRTGHV